MVLLSLRSGLRSNYEGEVAIRYSVAIVAGSLFDGVRSPDLCRHSPVTQYVLKLASYDLSTHVN